MKLKIEMKNFRLVPPYTAADLLSDKWAGASLTVKLRERPYFDLKLDQATQLSNGEHGSKLSLHFSQLSDFSSLASYVIPTVLIYQILVTVQEIF